MGGYVIFEGGGAGEFIWGKTAPKTTVFDGSVGTFEVPAFVITGVIALFFIDGVVTQAIGTNHTAGYFRLNDGTVQANVSAAAGITLSSLGIGRRVFRHAAVTSALGSLANNSAPRAFPLVTFSIHDFNHCVLSAKTGVTTTLNYLYSTTNNPTTGAVEWVVWWMPLSANGNLVPA